ncbi:MAG: hypothetical protein EOM23_04490, partial [Candidatus Moranbacteria bacterium]|nr:hypothetical protein [Candidatus Moranbacteria bacterium]
MRLFLLFNLIFFSGVLCHASNPDSVYFQSIERMALKLYNETPDSVKKEANDSIRINLKRLLETFESTRFPFDSLKFVKTISPKNNSFHLITWTVPFNEGHRYYGFLQVLAKNEIPDVIELMDNHAKYDLNQSYTADNWPGAVYYELIENQTRKATFYTLFGWVGGENGTAKRVIETLIFNAEETPVFGAPVFMLDQNKLQCRIVFEFTDQVPFHLAYEEQFIPDRRNRKGFMIVFNRLGGNDPEMGRFFRAAVPSYSIFDALIFDEGIWHLHTDIDPRTPDSSIPE